MEFTSLYQHSLIEEPPTTSAPIETRREYQMMTRKAANLCGGCPLSSQCLYDAVVRHDVNGFVGGTTQRQRNEMRHILGIKVAPEDFDTLAGVTTPHRQVDHNEVVRLRQANPHESLETIAQRLGCSLSTVKRHLRKARAAAAAGPKKAPEQPKLPTMSAVRNALVTVTQPARTRRAA
ncbi:WhiB family transcriptional regulator [Enemella sp. A6]|uniref:WhiB family transcriptional regulator n=1 Tax=Enemella sp. A6 TaxID=3440152 RepID=UPI003EBAB53B